MKEKKTEPIKTVYYQDERNDEFADDHITPRVIDENYCYVDSRLWWRVRRFVAYRLIAMPVAFFYCKLALHSTFRNRKLLKKVKGKAALSTATIPSRLETPFCPI